MNLRLINKWRRQSGLGLCAAIIMTVILTAIGIVIVYVIIKLCSLIPPKKTDDTNDPPQMKLVLTPPKPFDAWIARSGMIAVQTSPEVTTNDLMWTPLAYLEMSTNGGSRVMIQYDTNGQVMTQVGATVSDPAVTNEVWVPNATTPNRFYRLKIVE